jgi:hypothetical protein
MSLYFLLIPSHPLQNEKDRLLYVFRLESWKGTCKTCQTSVITKRVKKKSWPAIPRVSVGGSTERELRNSAFCKCNSYRIYHGAPPENSPANKIFKLRSDYKNHSSLNSLSLPLLCFFITFFVSIDINTAPRLALYTTILDDERRVTLSFPPSLHLVHLCLNMANIYLLHHCSFFL